MQAPLTRIHRSLGLRTGQKRTLPAITRQQRKHSLLKSAGQSPPRARRENGLFNIARTIFNQFHGGLKMKKGTIHGLVLLFTAMTFCAASVAWSADRAVIIGFHQKPGAAEKARVQGHKGKIKRHFKLARAIAAHLPEEEIARLKADPSVAYVLPEATAMAIEPVLGGPEYDAAWGVDHIGATAAHAQGILGGGVKVAVLDTGIDYTHPELVAAYRGGDNFVSLDPDYHDPYDDSWNSHGTHVAGVIAAAKNDAGVVGVAPNAELYAVKVLDGAGFGPESAVIAGIEWAVANQMNVINFSFGLFNPSPALEEVCQAAYDAGILMVAASGNTFGGEVLFPARYPSVIAVSATAPDDSVAAISSIGPEIELAAPGIGINSTIAGGSYNYLSGTSQASPHVAGVAALLLSAGIEDVNGDGLRDNRDARLQLQNTAKDLGPAGPDALSGYGLVNIGAEGDNPEAPTILVLTRDAGRMKSAERVTLADGQFSLSFINNSLAGVVIEVYENGIRLPELSDWVKFKRTASPVPDIMLNAAGRTLDVVLIPKGKRGATAEVEIRKIY